MHLCGAAIARCICQQRAGKCSAGLEKKQRLGYMKFKFLVDMTESGSRRSRSFLLDTTVRRLDDGNFRRQERR